MAIPSYLAMTAAEFQNCSSISASLAWMSCHFSSYTKGLSNLPERLPPGSMLVLDDANPVSGHDPDMVLHQLSTAVKAHICSCVLLDFQQPANTETAAMAAYLAKNLPCPAGVSHLYSKGLECAVLLPPVPPDIPLSEHIQQWKGREVWLELALDAIGYRVTKDGAVPFQPTCFSENGLADKNLCCHYAIESYDDHIDFTLWRTAKDLTHFIKKAENIGISRCVGLWQELQGI